MSLVAYQKKRSFEKTPEPQGGLPTSDSLKFVVQKHEASHLHYDFRLEMGGVLKSWAVPKGPSTNPKDKRLAMMVEDHPYDYRNFEGNIPEGQYGAGTVIVWDEGYYEPIESGKSLKANEKTLLKQLKSGALKIRLFGKKLTGEFALVKTNWKGDNSWLLIKHDDESASRTDILKKSKSVKSGKTISQVKKVPGKLAKESKTSLKKSDSKKINSKSLPKLISTDAEKRPIFKSVKPCLATLVDQPPNSSDWIYEIKWDGYRSIAYLNKAKVALQSRNDKSFTDKFFPIVKALQNWNINAVIDGEIVVLNKNGTANFGALQNWQNEEDGELVFYVFDILWYEGFDLTSLPLTDRRNLLSNLIPALPAIRFSESFDTSGEDFLAAATKMGLEGIMAKRKSSTYEINHRSSNWLKIKANKRQEVIIGGYTLNEGSGRPFSALLVGVYQDRKFVYTGKVGTGFSMEDQNALLKQFEKLKIEESPFSTPPNLSKTSRFQPKPPNLVVTWLKPELICEVSYTELTADQVMRHPSFKGMREDKTPKSIELETPQKLSLDENVESKYARSNKKQLLAADQDNQNLKVDGKLLKFTNLNKLYWPKENISKRDLINYYAEMAPYMLPYLKDRPQSLNRFPDGINGFSFYQKDVTDKVPDWANVYQYHTEDSDEDKHFLLGNNKATLLYMASLGCIEINPWSSTIKKPEHPTWCVIDLDPGKNTFEQVIEAARVTKDVLDEMAVSSFCKTSGSTGLHIYIPLGAKYTFEQSKEFAKIVATLVQRELPKYTTLERNVRARKGKMYIDFLQNRNSATLAAPYSVRPKPGATVSMPLNWDEVKVGLKMSDFNMFNALERVNSLGDIFKPVFGKGIELKKVIKKQFPDADFENF